MEIIPAIIPKDFYDLSEKMSRVVGLVPLVQIDILDGRFTPQPSWPYKKNNDPDFTLIIKEQRAFPHWEELDFEVDLMVENPKALVDDWITAGARRLIIHVESKGDPVSLAEEFSPRTVAKDLPFYTELGIAINIDTPLEALNPILSHIDFVQFMGIAKIGFQGEPFDERVISKIKEFKAQHPSILVSVDGGVSLENAKFLMEAGAGRLVAGSAIFGELDIAEAISQFQNLLK